MRIAARSLGVLGQTDCQYQVPGITPDPGIPICSASQLSAAQAQLAQQESEEPPSYVSTPQSLAVLFGGGTPLQAAQAAIAAGAPVTPGGPGYVPPTASASSGPSTSSSSAPVSTPSSLSSPSVALASSCFQLFGSTEPCWGPIGEYTVLAGIAVLIGLYFMTKGGR